MSCRCATFALCCSHCLCSPYNTICIPQISMTPADEISMNLNGNV